MMRLHVKILQKPKVNIHFRLFSGIQLVREQEDTLQEKYW